MNAATKTKLRHPVEAKILKRALDGDEQSVSNALEYLSSAYSALRKIMQKTIPNLADDRVWSISCDV
ncbi:MAG: hypothetical protein PVG14_01785 [Anaerolineales bacterium]|jgi:hypothetical protein